MGKSSKSSKTVTAILLGLLTLILFLMILGWFAYYPDDNNNKKRRKKKKKKNNKPVQCEFPPSCCAGKDKINHMYCAPNDYKRCQLNDKCQWQESGECPIDPLDINIACCVPGLLNRNDPDKIKECALIGGNENECESTRGCSYRDICRKLDDIGGGGERFMENGIYKIDGEESLTITILPGNLFEAKCDNFELDSLDSLECDGESTSGEYMLTGDMVEGIELPLNDQAEQVMYEDGEITFIFGDVELTFVREIEQFDLEDGEYKMKGYELDARGKPVPAGYGQGARLSAPLICVDNKENVEFPAMPADTGTGLFDANCNTMNTRLPEYGLSGKEGGWTRDGLVSLNVTATVSGNGKIVNGLIKVQSAELKFNGKIVDEDTDQPKISIEEVKCPTTDYGEYCVSCKKTNDANLGDQSMGDIIIEGKNYDVETNRIDQSLIIKNLKVNLCPVFVEDCVSNEFYSGVDKLVCDAIVLKTTTVIELDVFLVRK